MNNKLLCGRTSFVLLVRYTTVTTSTVRRIYARGEFSRKYAQPGSANTLITACGINIRRTYRRLTRRGISFFTFFSPGERRGSVADARSIPRIFPPAFPATNRHRPPARQIMASVCKHARKNCPYVAKRTNCRPGVREQTLPPHPVDGITFITVSRAAGFFDSCFAAVPG